MRGSWQEGQHNTTQHNSTQHTRVLSYACTTLCTPVSQTSVTLQSITLQSVKPLSHFSHTYHTTHLLSCSSQRLSMSSGTSTVAVSRRGELCLMCCASMLRYTWPSSSTCQWGAGGWMCRRRMRRRRVCVWRCEWQWGEVCPRLLRLRSLSPSSPQSHPFTLIHT